MSENENQDRPDARKSTYNPNYGKRREPSKDRDDSPQDFVKRRIYMRKKVCRFCGDKRLLIDYKNVDILRRFTTEGGKIIPRRITGNCAKHQRLMTKEIKKARYIALLPYVKQ